MESQTLENIEKILNEVAQREGVTLYDFEFIGRASGRILRVYIDKPNGVTIEECADVSNGLSLLLDVEDLIPGGRYELEVSSPGLERPLRQPWHFEAATGKTIKLKLNTAVFPKGQENKGRGLRGLSGKLVEFSNETALLDVNSTEYVVPLESIHKANVVFEFETSIETKKRNQPKKAKKKKK